MSKKEITVQDLVNDASFRRMVIGTASEQDIRKWNRWMESSDKNRQLAQKAMAEIAGFQFAAPSLPDVDEEWKKLSRDTIQRKEKTNRGTSKPGSFWKWTFRVASVVLLAAITGIAFYIYQSAPEPIASFEQIIEKQSVQTGADEHKIVRFNNGARMFLNSNSKITYSINQHTDKAIEVVVEGEVFFDSGEKMSSDASVFKVNTPDGVIRDIGTRFLVTVLRDRSRVVLEDGSVEVNMGDQQPGDQVVSMMPGELLEFNESEVVSKQQVNSSFYTSWATGVMEFDETTIREFVTYVQQRFDVEVQIVDEEVMDIKLTGGIYFRSLEELVRAVSDIANIPIYQSADRKTVYIGDHAAKN
ncbi:FecR family protein [Gracilimonas mengyeensis]|uniref:FecR family protein n=1 Tax=Gracilimonas mengyeensis TaxID=1302730 RepID=A0A521FGR3_9BACT|nr:FecR domain-containing protein [Gracilimonas mengyeensis]SMO95373.1 FecR family protein [Gracilimonas mengyeensis]